MLTTPSTTAGTCRGFFTWAERWPHCPRKCRGMAPRPGDRGHPLSSLDRDAEAYLNPVSQSPSGHHLQLRRASVDWDHRVPEAMVGGRHRMVCRGLGPVDVEHGSLTSSTPASWRQSAFGSVECRVPAANSPLVHCRWGRVHSLGRYLDDAGKGRSDNRAPCRGISPLGRRRSNVDLGLAPSVSSDVWRLVDAAAALEPESAARCHAPGVRG